jgi:tRNA 2-thiouridine synthesizing protein C
MPSHFFLLGGKLTQERLAWMEDSLKFFFVQMYPESLLHHTEFKEPMFTFLLTGDALYSVHDPETLQAWEIILLLPSVSIICDREELDLRGISVERLLMKHPDQVIDHNSLGLNGRTSFWKDVAKFARQQKQPLPSTIGFLQLESPYMHQSALHAVQCLASALEVQASIDLYAYLDGVHLGHVNQNPGGFENIGKMLEDLKAIANKRGLQCQMFACSRCTTARGYSTWDDGQGVMVSDCLLKPVKIRNLTSMIDQFELNHVILGENSGTIKLKTDPRLSRAGQQDTESSPPITILITHPPYGSEHAFGALSLAVACAYQGITTQVVFIEDGVYTVTGNHHQTEARGFINMQEMIKAVEESENLTLYVYQPSLHRRNLARSPLMNAVLEIGKPELGRLLFHSPFSNQANHRRLLFF